MKVPTGSIGGYKTESTASLTVPYGLLGTLLHECRSKRKPQLAKLNRGGPFEFLATHQLNVHSISSSWCGCARNGKSNKELTILSCVVQKAFPFWDIAEESNTQNSRVRLNNLPMCHRELSKT